VESFEDEKSGDSFIQRLDVMQVDEDPEEQCENPDVQKESLAKESELVADVKVKPTRVKKNCVRILKRNMFLSVESKVKKRFLNRN